MQRVPHLNIAEVSPHLICALCGGYLIDATTIVECLHSFCKTCIVHYLETSKYCPICEVLVHKTRPLQNIRLDHTLQDIVYKLVPGLFQEEMRRRRDYYKTDKTPVCRHRGHERIIYSADEQFSISLEFCPSGNITEKSWKAEDDDTRLKDKRYLMCPAGVTVGHLKKFIRSKFNLENKYQIDIFHGHGNVRDHYSLMDIAYIYSWRREGILAMYYSIYEIPPPVPKIEITECNPVCSVSEPASNRKPEPLSLAHPSLINGTHLPHDLSPLELIATVANDLSCLGEGRGMKRKVDAAELYPDNDEDSNSEIQIKKSIEHAIDLCSTTNPDSNDNMQTELKTENTENKEPSGQPNNPNRENEISKANSCTQTEYSKGKCIKTGGKQGTQPIGKASSISSSKTGAPHGTKSNTNTPTKTGSNSPARNVSNNSLKSGINSTLKPVTHSPAKSQTSTSHSKDMAKLSSTSAADQGQVVKNSSQHNSHAQDSSKTNCANNNHLTPGSNEISQKSKSNLSRDQDTVSVKVEHNQPTVFNGQVKQTEQKHSSPLKGGKGTG